MSAHMHISVAVILLLLHSLVCKMLFRCFVYFVIVFVVIFNTFIISVVLMLVFLPAFTCNETEAAVNYYFYTHCSAVFLYIVIALILDTLCIDSTFLISLPSHCVNLYKFINFGTIYVLSISSCV